METKFLSTISSSDFKSAYTEYKYENGELFFAIEGGEKITLLKLTLTSEWNDLYFSKDIRKNPRSLLNRFTSKVDWKYIENDLFVDSLEITRQNKNENKNNKQIQDAVIKERKKLKFS